MAVDLLLCVATELEGALLRERLDGSRLVGCDRSHGRRAGQRRARRHALSRAQPDAGAIVVCGVGGAYPASGLHVGDVVCAASECYGDLGATSPSGFLDMKALGFPVVEAPVPSVQRPSDAGVPRRTSRSVRDRVDLHRHRRSRARHRDANRRCGGKHGRRGRRPRRAPARRPGRRSAGHQQHRDQSRHQPAGA